MHDRFGTEHRTLDRPVQFSVGGMEHVTNVRVRGRIRKGEVIVSLHQGGLRLDQFERLAHIKPNTINGLSVHRPAQLQEFWEELFAKIEFFSNWNVLEHLRLQDVQTGVDHVAKRLFRRWFLQEATNIALSKVTVHLPIRTT